MAEPPPYADLGSTSTGRRWNPLNRALYLGIRGQLRGTLLNAKGDRVACILVETVPLLEEDVFDYLAKIHPRGS